MLCYAKRERFIFSSSDFITLCLRHIWSFSATVRSKDKQDFKITLNGKQVLHSPQIKILGNLVTDNLTWDSHVERFVLPGLRNRVRTLGLTTKYMDPKFKRIYTNSIYRSKLMFAIDTWGGCSTKLLKKVQHIQDKASKIVIGKQHPRDSANQRQQRLNWLPIKKEVELATHQMTWKVINLGIPEHVSSLMSLNLAGQRLQTQRKLAAKPRWLDTKKVFKQTYRSRAYKYNTLPGHITSQTTFNKFKKLTKAYLLTRRD